MFWTSPLQILNLKLFGVLLSIDIVISQARLWACGRGDMSTPSFGSHLNPILTRGGRLCPPYTGVHTKFWKPQARLTFDQIGWFSSHTGSNFIPIVVARAISNFSKNDTFLISRIWKMGRNLFSSLAIKDNLKVAFLEKNSSNPNKYLVTITVWALAQLFCLMLITRSKSGYMTRFSQKMPLSNY